MASSAGLRLAGRALRGLPSSFPRALVAVGERSLQHPSPMPHQIMVPRRLYSTELNPKVAKKLTSEERVSTKLDKLASGYKEISDNHKRVGVILREKKERERRRLVLEGVVILTGLAFWLKRHFFPQNQ